LILIAAATTPPKFITLVLLTAVSVLSLNMFLPSLSNIAREFQADYAIVNLSIAGYLAISALLQIIMGRGFNLPAQQAGEVQGIADLAS
jgi:DHA1 family bicyclomycin/chloramphenicol resistance-like MFS transporter